MKKLLLLTLCLLVVSKVFSQNDIKNKYVILTENQSKAIIKDLIHMEALESINENLETRIKNLLIKEGVYHDIINTKDNIIDNQNKIIEIKDKIINSKKSIEFHSYIGVRTFNVDIASPIFYFRSQLELKKINVGAMANFQPAVPNSTVDGFNYSIFVEYKIF